MNILGYEYKSGDCVTCKISDLYIKDAVISFDNNNTFYICTNDPRLNGSNIKNKYGYLYAYGFSLQLTAKNGSMQHVNKAGDIPYYFKDLKHLFSLERKDSEVSDDLNSYFNSINKSLLLRVFRYKLGIFDEYTKFSISEKEGMIELSNSTGKKVEIKFGRFLRKTLNKVQIELSDSELEKMYNQFILHQNKQLIEIVFYKGDDILKGYTKSLQMPNTLSLAGSCMNDKYTFLELYTKNTDIVQLAAFYNHGDSRILARCIIWKIDENTYVHDKIYFAHDWIDGAFKSALSSQNIKSIYTYPYLILKLDKYRFKHYPYMDSFNLFDKKNGCLIYQSSDITGLTNQNGGPDLQWEVLD